MKQIDEIQQVAKDVLPQLPKAAMASHWAAAVGTILLGLLYAALPSRVMIFPNWLPLLLEILLVVPLVFLHFLQHPLQPMIIRILAFAILAVTTITLMGSIIEFVITLPQKDQSAAQGLLQAAAVLWISNILVFALWYWEIDGGGPKKRHQHGHQAADFMFPQQQIDNYNGAWAPRFLDYLFVAFTGTTAFSPTDTFPLTHLAKSLMMVEALNAMVILAIIVGRVVNIL